MSAHEISRAIAELEISVNLLLRAAEALSAWEHGYDPTRELDTARELHLRALSLRVLLEVERREKVLHRSTLSAQVVFCTRRSSSWRR